MHKDDTTVHVPVLLEEVLQYLDPKRGDIYLDVTAGYGGHASRILELTDGEAVLVDRDEAAINVLLRKFTGPGIRILHDDFASAAKKLKDEGGGFDIILADLGISSPHIDNASRGFAIQHDAGLDMRMDNRQVLDAAGIINDYPEAALARILQEYGQEPHARRIAKAIVEHRPLRTTSALADVVVGSIGRFGPKGRNRIHPATRTFQAIRIAVNDELSLVESALPLLIDLLNPGGRIAVISFHSLEDRIVKTALKNRAGDRYDAELQLLTHRPVTAGSHELVSNPRARSAKLRAAVKIKK